MEDWDNLGTEWEFEYIDEAPRITSIASECQICGKESDYHRDICKECASRLKAILYPKSANIDELI